MGALLVLFPPGSSGLYPACPFLALTGLDCPFCGGLRGSHELLTGNVVAAADQNILVPLLAVAAIAGVVGWLWGRRPGSGGGVPQPRVTQSAPMEATRTRAVWLFLLFLFLLFWVVRNIPGVPFLPSGIG